MFFRKKEIKIPKHVAFIVDGNRRWAVTHGKSSTYGYSRGADIVDVATTYMIKHGVQIVSFFLFSTENWNRPKNEVDFLMDMMIKEMPKHAQRAHEQNIRVKFIGRRDRFLPGVVKMIDKYEALTTENTDGTIVLALDYGGHDEIVRATNSAIAAGVAVDIDTYETFMDTGDLLPIDLAVRTGRDQRLSNFMLWKLAYAELLFYPKYWPALRERDFEKMLNEYNKRQRRFGK
jgi:undecaprenyl diphosphate synthase